MNPAARRCFAVVPAAGSGARVGAAVPKQYLPLAGTTVLDRTLSALLAPAVFECLVLVLAPDDTHWQASPLAGDPRIVTAQGAGERSESVRNGLLRLREFAQADDLIAVHDAARPCLAQGNLREVLAVAAENADGALLALPVSDTLKRADATGHAVETVSRERLWRAQTPQVFPFRHLCAALEEALSVGLTPTDEAQAMERAGYRPRLVSGSPDNLKITHPHDFALAEALLRQAEGD